MNILKFKYPTISEIPKNHLGIIIQTHNKSAEIWGKMENQQISKSVFLISLLRASFKLS